MARDTRAFGVAAAALIVLFTATPGWPHHVGTYTARDNAISANFKQIKFSIQAGKFDVARSLFEDGALRKEMLARAGRLPPGLPDTVANAIRARDSKTAEAALALFFSALARDLAREADARLADPGTGADARVAAGGKFLEAIWRYWNLIDFAVSERDPKAAVAMRLAFEEAETESQPGPRRVATAADPARLRASFARVARTLSDVIESLSAVTRRNS